MRILNFLKFLVIIFVLGLFSYFYMLLNINKPSIISGSLEKERTEAFFLNLNEDVLNEISQKKQYSDLREMPKEDLNKEELFESLNKVDYNF